MKKTGTKHIILSLLVFLVFADIKEIQAQAEIFDQFNAKISGLNYEKVYLHIDRSIYSVKDDIWFKIYLTDGKTHIPVSGYNTVYVDLTDSVGNILIHKPYLIENGTGHGNFTIADTLKTGTYTIYAYTNYLRNFGINSFFRREISISYIRLAEDQQDSELEDIYPPDKLLPRPSLSLQFMPEGGYLSDNITNILAFKITGFDGKGINLKGVIKDSDGHFIDSLQSTHLGMGKIIFRPQSGIHYHALLDEFPADTFLLPSSTDKPLLQYTGIKDSIIEMHTADM